MGATCPKLPQQNIGLSQDAQRYLLLLSGFNVVVNLCKLWLNHLITPYTFLQITELWPQLPYYMLWVNASSADNVRNATYSLQWRQSLLNWKYSSALWNVYENIPLKKAHIWTQPVHISDRFPVLSDAPDKILSLYPIPVTLVSYAESWLELFKLMSSVMIYLKWTW